jgi:hypothetical protein
VKVSEMQQGKRYRIVLEDTVRAVGSRGMSTGHRYLEDDHADIISIEEIDPEYPVGTVAIHRGDSGGVYVYRNFRDGWYDMSGKKAEWYSVSQNQIGMKSVQYVLPEEYN